MVNRCQWLLGVGVVAGAAAQSASGFAMSESEAHKTQKRALDLSEFEPKSMLQVHENIAFTITPNDKDLGELDAANQSLMRVHRGPSGGDCEGIVWSASNRGPPI